MSTLSVLGTVCWVLWYLFAHSFDIYFIKASKLCHVVCWIRKSPYWPWIQSCKTQQQGGITFNILNVQEKKTQVNSNMSKITSTSFSTALLPLKALGKLGGKQSRTDCRDRGERERLGHFRQIRFDKEKEIKHSRAQYVLNPEVITGLSHQSTIGNRAEGSKAAVIRSRGFWMPRWKNFI